MDPGALRNFKDFLQLYNRMTEMCFGRCVDNMNSRNLDQSEIDCVEDCSMKFIKFNNKLMHNFVIAQQEIVNKRVTEMDRQQQEINGSREIEKVAIGNSTPEITAQTDRDILAVDIESSSEVTR